MARRMDADAKVKQARDNVAKYKKLYDGVLEELKGALDIQKKAQAEMIIEAMEKKGKSFNEVLRLINL